MKNVKTYEGFLDFFKRKPITVPATELNTKALTDRPRSTFIFIFFIFI